jgi:hypothetical protein
MLEMVLPETIVRNGNLQMTLTRIAHLPEKILKIRTNLDQPPHGSENNKNAKNAF